MSFIVGRVVLVRGASLPYKVVLENGADRAEHPVATVREGEALIRKQLTMLAQPVSQEADK
jgi:hypothetical protein